MLARIFLKTLVVSKFGLGLGRPEASPALQPALLGQVLRRERERERAGQNELYFVCVLGVGVRMKEEKKIER